MFHIYRRKEQEKQDNEGRLVRGRVTGQNIQIINIIPALYTLRSY